MIMANVAIMTGWIAKENVLTNSWTVNGTIREKSPIAREYDTTRRRIRRSVWKKRPRCLKT